MLDPDAFFGYPRSRSATEGDELLQRRILVLHGIINDDKALDLVSRLLYLEYEDCQQPIHFYVDSVGGGVCPSLEIIDTIAFLKAPVYTYCGKQAQGAAAIIVASGAKGRRYARPDSILSILPVFGSDSGANRDEFERDRHRLADLISKRTGQPTARVLEDMLRGRTLDARAAVEYGVVDAVLGQGHDQGGGVPSWSLTERKGEDAIQEDRRQTDASPAPQIVELAGGLFDTPKPPAAPPRRPWWKFWG